MWIMLTILLVLAALIIWFVGSLFLFKPQNLGVTYTQADYERSLEKTGIQIEFDGKSGKELEKYKETLGSKKLSINDYIWEFSDYQPKSFTLSPSEASALLNEIAPAFWWFDNLQVNVLPDGTMEGSSTADIGRLKNDLYSDVNNSIPIPLPDKLNIYSKGTINITGNRLTGDPQAFEIGSVPLPEQYLTDESVTVMAGYFERIYTVVPGLEIQSLTANKAGEFVFEGVIPQSVKVTPKN